MGSTTINSSDLSALKVKIESTQIAGISEHHVRRLKKKIYKLEQNNKELEAQVIQWREKYYDIKNEKEKVKDDVVSQIHTKLILMQENHFLNIENKFKAVIEELTTKLNRTVEEKKNSETRLRDLSEQLALLKIEQEHTNDSHQKKERLMRFAL